MKREQGTTQSCDAHGTSRLRLGAPKVITSPLDDVGFAQIGRFIGLINTPNIDRLARNGLRSGIFHTTAPCLPSRAITKKQD